MDEFMLVILIATNLVIAFGAVLSGYFYGKTKGTAEGYALGLKVSAESAPATTQSEER